ncbi:uncharacterized protein LOC126323889 [Schistocerca gregaria]|uniref:uncharacterized protein LOC126323889 n=1 Tax=Schistocerca gregaria TaxID=7010 RepID=UPI00211DA8F2|nr:uncharacterized protein LOC126323889 [Schistocerca gregaria]
MQSSRSIEAQAKSCHKCIQLACEKIMSELKTKNERYIKSREILVTLKDKNDIKVAANNFIYEQFYFKAIGILYSYAMPLLPILVFALRRSSCFKELMPSVLNIVYFAPLLREKYPDMFTARTIMLSLWKKSLMKDGTVIEEDKIDSKLKIYLGYPELDDNEVMGYADLMLRDQIGGQAEHWIEKWCEEYALRQKKSFSQRKEVSMEVKTKALHKSNEHWAYPKVRGILKTDLKGRAWLVNHYGVVLVNMKDSISLADGDVIVATVETNADGQKRATILSRSSCCFFCLNPVSVNLDPHLTCSGDGADSRGSHSEINAELILNEEVGEVSTDSFEDQIDINQTSTTTSKSNSDFEGELEWDDRKGYGFVVHPTIPWVIGVIPAEQVTPEKIGKNVYVYIVGSKTPKDGKLYCTLNPHLHNAI